MVGYRRKLGKPVDKLGKLADKLGKLVDKLGKLVATRAARVDQRWLLGRRVCCKGSVG